MKSWNDFFRKKLITCSFIILNGILYGQTLPAYLDENIAAHDRVYDLLSRLTVEEKVSLLIASSPGIPRLGIDKYYHGNEALHGIVRPGNFTVFPQAIGLASMWDPELQYKIASAISDEARGRWNELELGKKQLLHFNDLLTFWSPVVNMARDPRWGRTPETYGEDPWLSSVLGVRFIKGLQGDNAKYLKVVATPKHFVANNEEHNRSECNAIIPIRSLREYYFPAFEACIRDGQAAAIMSAYNAINDIPCTANPWLLTKVLRNEWGFKGYVVSDCGAPNNLVTRHLYVKTKELAAMVSIKAGLDLECGDNIFKEPLLNAYKLGMVTAADIDSAAYRVLLARMKLGLFDNPEENPYNKISPSVVGCEAHKTLALEAAKESIVLLKNENKTLPLNIKKIKSIAVVGINAANTEFGDYSGTPVGKPVSILEGIRNKVGNKIKVLYAPWQASSPLSGFQLISKSFFPGGLRAEYYSSKDLKGDSRTSVEECINFDPANQPPDPFLPAAPMSIRWIGKIRVTVSGVYHFGFASDDGCRLMINGKVVIDEWVKRSLKINFAEINLEAGKDYEFKAEYFNEGKNGSAKLYWTMPANNFVAPDLFSEARKAVKNSDIAVVVLGINKTIESEGVDRQDIQLPKDQQDFIKDMYKANPNIVVVLIAGSSLAINWINDSIPAIVDAWYPGQEGGTAVADVLFGDYNPSGRLPLTFYKSINELPPFNDYDITKGRTYQYYQGIPLYPFGYGLSYTTFTYTDLQVTDVGHEIKVSYAIKNNGTVDGDEVSQVYVRFPDLNIITPIKQLKGFKRVYIRHGKSVAVEILIDKKQLRYWDENQSGFTTPGGTYQIMVGASSADIRLAKKIIL
ncbi:MAG: glycoside hydrolase family 3 C-terminal domain-containing protein [Bacteroidetes bacterium]|nr:glycoside hydrolase family 3 C-terminal domain-containing protein [Bacteroidota bacterium]